MSEQNKEKFRISIGAYGSIEIEAPTKADCIEMFREVAAIKQKSKLDEAIR